MGDLVLQGGFLALQLADFALIGTYDGWIASRNESGQQGIDFFLNGLDLAFAGLNDFLGLRQALRPRLGEHGFDQREEFFCWLQFLDDLADLAFKLVAGRGLAKAGAVLGLAQIIGVALIASLRPGTAQGRAAIGTGHKTAQGKVIADILADGQLCRTVAALLHFIKGLDGNQRLMMAFQPVDPIRLAADMAGIERIGHDIGDPLEGDLALSIAREIRRAFKQALHLCRTAKTTRSNPLKPLAHHGGKRPVREQHLAAPFDRLIFVTYRGVMNPIAALHPRLHLLRDLPSVLLALQRALGGHDGLDELALRRLIKGEVQALNPRAATPEGIAQIKVEPRVARKAFEIIKDDDEVFLRDGVEIAQKRHHTGALHEVTAAGYRIGKRRFDLISLGLGVFAAASFLGFETMPFGFLRFGRDAAVNQGFGVIGHRVALSRARRSSRSAAALNFGLDF